MQLKKTNVKQVVITEDQSGQRIDNFLHRYFGNLPKSRVYQMLRKGEVRVNKGRIQQTYKIKKGDIVRVPPVFLQDKGDAAKPSTAIINRLSESIIYDDANFSVINKPAGIAVHSGTGQVHGVIDALRCINPAYELVHRLDKDTSGCLILAKNNQVLRKLNDALKTTHVKKYYQALLAGRISQKKFVVKQSLKKSMMKGGERMVQVDEEGKSAITNFKCIRSYRNATLVEIELETGRTHQIRVHSADYGHPILGDTKYGNKAMNSAFKKLGLKRMFLHASSISLKHPVTGEKININAPLDEKLNSVLNDLR